jgi:chemotaxis protein CheD
MGQLICVGMGELAISAYPGNDIACLGLGSCIAICAFDNRLKIGAMAHVVLPDSAGREAKNTAKYADLAIPLLTNELECAGSYMRDVQIILVGGASIFQPFSKTMDIGKRNYEAVKMHLQKTKLPIVREDVGGTESRTIILNVKDGILRLRTVRTGDNVFHTFSKNGIYGR